MKGMFPGLDVYSYIDRAQHLITAGEDLDDDLSVDDISVYDISVRRVRNFMR